MTLLSVTSLVCFFYYRLPAGGCFDRVLSGRVSAGSDHRTVAVPRSTDSLVVKTQQSSQKWEDQKETLIELYICRDMTLKSVVSVMKAQGFHAR